MFAEQRLDVQKVNPPLLPSAELTSQTFKLPFLPCLAESPTLSRTEARRSPALTASTSARSNTQEQAWSLVNNALGWNHPTHQHPSIPPSLCAPCWTPGCVALSQGGGGQPPGPQSRPSARSHFKGTLCEGRRVTARHQMKGCEEQTEERKEAQLCRLHSHLSV